MLQCLTKGRANLPEHLIAKLFGGLFPHELAKDAMLRLQETPVDRRQLVSRKMAFGPVVDAAIANTDGQISAAPVHLILASVRLLGRGPQRDGVPAHQLGKLAQDPP